ncbi:MAG: glycosyltransferase family 4 protein [Ilumatobacteraceae bacterium]
MGLVFVGDRCCDHSPSSGYDQVIAQFPTAGWLSGKALERGDIDWLRAPSAADASVAFHVIYGDCSGCHLPALLRRRHPGRPVIATVHKPATRLLADAEARGALEDCDALIALTRSQSEGLRASGCQQPITVIPHGVSIDAFRTADTAPPPSPSGPILVVGSFLRDWQFAQRVLASPRLRHREVLAVGATARTELRGLPPNVQFTDRLSETELAGCYRTASALFLPVLDGTASNALLEAMAAGCPVICPDLPGFVEDYLGDREDTYAPGDVQSAVDRLDRGTDVGWRRRRAVVLSGRARHFDWSRLRDRYLDAYATVGYREPHGCRVSDVSPAGVL